MPQISALRQPARSKPLSLSITRGIVLSTAVATGVTSVLRSVPCSHNGRWLAQSVLNPARASSFLPLAGKARSLCVTLSENEIRKTA